MALLYIVAGEPSGDYLGGKLMAALRRTSPHLVMHGVGGAHMAQQGLESLFPMQELSVMGFLEVLPHIRNLRRRLHQTAADVLRTRPDAVVTVDSPGFTFRLAGLLKGSGIPLIHYVAPTVWAYKPERAAKTAALFNHLLTLFPFEPRYFEAEGLAATCTGHPLVEDWRMPPDAAAFRAVHDIGPSQPFICLLPGSRMGELKRHLPIFGAALAVVAQQVPSLAAVIPCLPHTADYVRGITAGWSVPLLTVTTDAERKQALAGAQVALSKSGTISLELALAGTPMVTTYRVNALSAFLLRRMLKSPYVNLVNILTGRAVVPELLQERCGPQALAAAVLNLLNDPAAATAQRAAFTEAATLIGADWPTPPSDMAAQTLLRLVPALRG